MSFGCIKRLGGFVCEHCDICEYKPRKIKQSGTDGATLDSLLIVDRNGVISCKVAV